MTYLNAHSRVKEESQMIGYFLVGVVVVALFVLVFVTGSAPIDTEKPISATVAHVIDTNTDGDQISTPEPTRSPSEIPPNAGTGCTCPTLSSGPMRGSVDRGVRIGQIEFDGNDPYTYPNCASNAQEVLDLMQDEQMFNFAKTLTRSSIGSFPPKKMYYTWDRLGGYCKMYTTCPNLHGCRDDNTVTGILQPTPTNV